MVLINKWIISNRFLRYTPFWWWWRYVAHEGYRFDDIQLGKSFWSSLNGGYEDMNYKWAFETFWGKGSYPPEKIILSKQNYDTLVDRLNEPPDPKAIEKLTEILRKPAPWDT
jgi:hypothetical protein